MEEMVEMKDSRVEMQYAPIDDFVPNPWNPNKQTDFIKERLRRSLEEEGFISPMLVRETNEAGVFEIINGEHRWFVAKELGMLWAPYISLGDISDVRAKRLTIVLNETKGEFDPIELSELLQSMQNDMTVEELFEQLPYRREELDSWLAMLDYDPDQYARDAVEPTVQVPSSDDDWVDLEFRIPISASEAIEEEIGRIVDISNFQTESMEIKRGLALERMAILSSQTPVESLE